MMELWQKHQKHVEDVRALYKELNFLDRAGKVCYFNGRSFWPRMNALGHDKSAFEDCKCKNAG